MGCRCHVSRGCACYTHYPEIKEIKMKVEQIKNLKSSLIDLKKGIKEYKINDTWFNLLNEIMDELVSIKENSNYKQITIQRDDSCHWYVLPVEMKKEFEQDLLNQDFCDSGEFDSKYSCYMIGGALGLVQLYKKTQ